MSIKRSTLESKWYYRALNTLLMILPLLALVFLYNKGYIVIKDLFQTNVLNTLQKNSTVLIYIVVGIILYYIILSIIWRAFFYIVFGGVEDDIRKKAVVASAISQSATVSGAGDVVNYLKQSEQKRGEAILWIILLIIFIYLATYNWGPSNNNKISPIIPNKCVSTGCGSNWLCSGSYYSDGVKKGINGCYSSKTQITTLPSWSGTCRQCP